MSLRQAGQRPDRLAERCRVFLAEPAADYNLSSVTRAGGRTLTYAYDPADRLTG
ncbi:MAG: RHS repeat domain-containing protein, partial [Candidatus Eremiobacterota bacterium]